MRVRLHRTSDEGMPFEVIDDDSGRHTYAGLFVDEESARRWCRARRWEVVEVSDVLRDDYRLDDVQPAPKRRRGKPKDTDTIALAI